MPYTDDPNNPRNQDPNASTDALAAQLASLNAALANGTITPEQAQRQLPDNTHLEGNQAVVNDPSLMPLYLELGAIGAGIGGPALANFLGGPSLEGIAAGGEGGAASTAVPAASSSALADMLPGAELGAPAAATGTGMNLSSFLKPFDPVTAALGVASLFGKSGPQEREGYSGPTTNAEATLSGALGNTNALLTALKNRGPVQLRSSYVQPGPAPVNVPGLGFQIGGGLGQDPALKDPNLLIGPDFLQSLAGNPNTAVRR